MSTIELRHVAGSNPPSFHVFGETRKRLGPFAVPAPREVVVAGGRKLLTELGWYLETFLEYPFSPETERAERLLEALKGWGRAAFDALFGGRDAGGLLDRATQGSYEHLRIEVWSDDPAILSWPWEALHDAKASYLAVSCQIERRLNGVPESPRGPALHDRVNILLVTARPLEGDVAYRSVSRPLVELIDKENLRARVHVLRPPTLAQLRAELRARPGYYHLLHFDGHGGYGEAAAQAGFASGGHRFRGPEGRLLFEKEDGSPDPVSATVLGALLREHRLPVVVLNACQSAQVDERAEDAFASVAAALVHAGTRSVVAMAYSLYVSGAREFLPAFYRRLFETGSVSEAVREGRLGMYAQRGRVCAVGRYELEDWLVPVLYRQGEEVLEFVAGGKAVERPKRPDVVAELERELAYGFVGRDGALLELERGLRGEAPAIVVSGLGGVGKTTLARGFVKWLAETEGLGEGCSWVSFQGVRSVEYVWNLMGEGVLGVRFLALPAEKKPEVLAEALRERQVVVVWDNFEVVAGAGGEAPTLTEEDRQALRRFLQALRGGKSRVIVTSRDAEMWLGPERRPVRLGGLEHEERWDYCDAVLQRLRVRRKEPELVRLMELLGGHPLAMRVILPRLETQSAGALVEALTQNLAALGRTGDEVEDKLWATLALAEKALPAELRELLLPLSLHEQFVDGNFLEAMAKQAAPAQGRKQIDAFLAALVAAGLLMDRGQGIYELHPALVGFLRATLWAQASENARDPWSRAFVDVMGRRNIAGRRPAP